LAGKASGAAAAALAESTTAAAANAGYFKNMSVPLMARNARLSTNAC